MTGDERSTAGVQAANARIRAQALPASGAWCAAAAFAALATGWDSTLTPAGRGLTIGLSAAAVAVPVLGGVALVLLVAAWLRPHSAALPGWAAPCAAIAALVCWVSGARLDGQTHAGAGPWLAGFGFGAAAILALLAGMRAENPRER